MPTLKKRRKKDGYWITGVPDTDDLGPYPTKAEADDALHGLTRFYEADEKERLLQRIPIRRLKKPPLRKATL